MSRVDILTTIETLQANYDRLVGEYDELNVQMQRVTKDRDIVYSSRLLIGEQIEGLHRQLYFVDQEDDRRWSVFIDYCNTPSWRYKC